MAVRRPWGGDRGPYSDGADDEDDVLTGAPRRMRFDDGEDGDVPHMGTKIGQMQLGQSSDVEYTMEKTRFTGHVPLVERTMIDRALSGETALWYATTTPAALYNGISAHFYMRERMMKYMMGDIPGDTEALAQTRMPQEERAYDLIAFARLVAGVAGEAVVHTVTLAYRVPLVGRMPPRSVLFFVFATEEERRLEALAKQANPDDRKKMVRDHGVFDHQTTADPPLVNYFHDPERSDTLGLAKPSAPPVSQQAGSSADAQQQQRPACFRNSAVSLLIWPDEWCRGPQRMPSWRGNRRLVHNGNNPPTRLLTPSNSNPPTRLRARYNPVPIIRHYAPTISSQTTPPIPAWDCGIAIRATNTERRRDVASCWRPT